MAGIAALVPYLLAAIGLVAVVGVSVVVFVLRKAIASKRAPDYDVEYFYKAETGSYAAFPSIDDKATKTVSVVIPAYNEEKRIPPMLTEMLAHLEETAKKDRSFTWEILVVDDGSKKDDTSGFVYKNYVQKYGAENFRLLTLHVNNGKGGAVRKGMVRARGQYLLMADADGATRAADLSELLSSLKRIEKDGEGIAIGSRAHLEDAEGDAKAKRTPLRKFLMFCSHLLITTMLGSREIKDTQCGFKLFTRKTASKLFTVQHIDRWAFDVELLYLAIHSRTPIPMVEVPVTWNEIDGSKLDVLTDTLQMTRDITAIRCAYMLGFWSMHRDAPEIKSADNGSSVPVPTALPAKLKSASASANAGSVSSTGAAPAAGAQTEVAASAGSSSPGAVAEASPQPEAPRSSGGVRKRRQDN